MHREWTGAEGFGTVAVLSLPLFIVNAVSLREESLEADMYVNTHSYDAAVACAGAAVGACHAVCTGMTLTHGPYRSC